MTADRLLSDVVPSLRDNARALGADGWFFIRYADPDEHLRVRFHGDPEALAAVRAKVARVCGAALDSGMASRLVFDTYEREMERYGGPAGMPIAEEIFAVDSDAVLELLQRIERGERGEQERWQLAGDQVAEGVEAAGVDAAIIIGGLRFQSTAPNMAATSSAGPYALTSAMPSGCGW